MKNVRPTKSIYSKDVPSYVPPSRAYFTPPLPREYQNPFADKPTLRGTNSDAFGNRRPLPPPSLVPKDKDRIPFRPDIPPGKVVNVERLPDRYPPETQHNESAVEVKYEKKKTLNTPSQNVNLEKIGDYYGLNRNLNESNFEYEKGYIPSITRILSGSNGRHDDLPDILLRITATPNVQQKQESKTPKTRAPPVENKMEDGRHGPKIQGEDEEENKKIPKNEERLPQTEVARTENINIIKKEV